MVDDTNRSVFIACNNGSSHIVYRDLKVIILGPASVGKTCFMQRYLTGEFKENVEPVSPIKGSITRYSMPNHLNPVDEMNYNDFNTHLYCIVVVLSLIQFSFRYRYVRVVDSTLCGINSSIVEMALRFNVLSENL